MNRKTFFVFLILFLITAHFAYSQTISIDNAVLNCVQYLQNRYPNGTRAALIVIQSENAELGELVLKKISASLINNNWIKVVERNAYVLDQINQEMDRHLSAFISRETELFLGRQLGAQIIISGSFTRNGQNWLLDIQAVNAETAERTGHFTAENIRSDSSWDTLVPGKSAGLFFTDNTLAARGRQTITSAFRYAFQAFNTGFEINENAVSGAGHGFNIDVYLINTPSGLLQAEVIIYFLQNGRILHENGKYIIREFDEAMIARRIGEKIRSDREFFSRVNSLIR